MSDARDPPPYVAMQRMLGLQDIQFDEKRMYPPIMQPVIKAVRTNGNVLAAVEGVVHGFGFSEFLFGTSAAHHPSSGKNAKLLRITPLWALSNAPLAWAEEYVKCGFIEIDPRVQGLVDSALPVYWDQSLRSCSERLALFLERAAHYGIRSGVSYLIPSADRFGCIAAYSSDRAVLDDVSRGLLQQHEPNLLTFGTYCHEILVRQMVRRGARPIVPGVSVTQRERDILRITARGATNDEAAIMLGISERTVQAHMDSVRLKLHAATRSEAILLAEQAGLIDFPDTNSQVLDKRRFGAP